MCGESAKAGATDYVGPSLSDFDCVWTERRSAPRLSLFLRSGKLIVNDQEYPCTIYDASKDGVRIRVTDPIAEHGTFSLELGHGTPIPVEIVWSKGHSAGLRFSSEIDIGYLLADN